MKKLIISLLIIGTLCVVLLYGSLYVLKMYSGHWQPLVEVPDVSGLRAVRAINTLNALGLEAEVIDTVYREGSEKLTVINQNPEALDNVKRGRKIYLVINSNRIPMVEVPNLAGRTSLDQAENLLKRNGLKLGRVLKRLDPSVQSIHDKPVLGQRYHLQDKSIAPGTRIQKHSEIDLVIGVPENFMEIQDSTQTP